MRGENRSTRRKISRSRVENQQTQPTYDADSGNRTRATLVGGERSTTAPTLLPLCANPAPPSVVERKYIKTKSAPISSLVECWQVKRTKRKKRLSSRMIYHTFRSRLYFVQWWVNKTLRDKFIPGCVTLNLLPQERTLGTRLVLHYA